jgi:hypothetical protein
MKAFRGYAVCEQDDGHTVGFIRNGCFGGGGKSAIRWKQVAFHKRLFYEVCFGSRLRSDTLKGETTRGGSRMTNRQAAPLHKMF